MTTVVMPQLGEPVMEGTVVRWIAKTGQKVERVEPLAKEGAVVTVGGPLARLDEAGSASSTSAPKAAATPTAPTASGPAQAASSSSAQAPAADANGVRSTPVGRNVAQEHGLDLSKVPGSGAGGRVMKADVTSFLE